ncbi:hypothetical protein BKA70DRAFT_1230041 [Coprinopsis sp. MPI-PUGE-AT-0042]|nr:hypothetical protein BKA70DRAFT_1230041 [Coprinopsis sp. MPI-PUGE-AT-0042]
MSPNQDDVWRFNQGSLGYPAVKQAEDSSQTQGNWNFDSPAVIIKLNVCNDILPTTLIPLLNECLFQLSRSIEALDDETADLEAVVHAKKTTRALLKRERTIHSGIKSPVRSIPPELWTIIFGYVLGAEPFGVMERRTYTCLRSVCSSWRRVATVTPGLCTGLVIDVEGWLGYRILPNHDLAELLEAFKEYITPWLSIISSAFPYHLRLYSKSDSEGQAGFLDDDEREAIVAYLFSTPRSPTSLSTFSSDVLWILVDSESFYPGITDLDVDTIGLELSQEDLNLPEVFPNLENLVVQSRYTLSYPSLAHANLGSLILLDLDGTSEDLSCLLGCLPTLRELEISSGELFAPSTGAPRRLAGPMTHPTLEILAVHGEDLIFLLEYIATPSLKFFGIDAAEFDDRDQNLINAANLFLQRSCVANLTVSLKGNFSSSFFFPLTQCLPTSTHLYIDVVLDRFGITDDMCVASTILFKPGALKEIFCSQLWWLKEGAFLAPQNPPINVFLAVPLVDEEGGKRNELREAGYEVKLRSRGDILGRMSRPIVPAMKVRWKFFDW